MKIDALLQGRGRSPRRQAPAAPGDASAALGHAPAAPGHAPAASATGR